MFCYWGITLLVVWVAMGSAPCQAVVADEGRFILDLVQVDNPRDTMESFYQAMEDYKRGVELDDPNLRRRLEDAVRTLNLDHLPVMTRQQEGKELAILLKEVLDRTLVLNFAAIPDDPETRYWRSRGGVVATRKVTAGEREGEHLISQETVRNVGDLFERVRHLPYLRGTGGGAAYRMPWIDQYLPEWAHSELGGVAYWQWMGLFLAILAGLTLKTLVRGLGKILIKLAKRTATKWDAILVEAVAGPVALLTASLLWWMAVISLRFTGVVRDVLVYGVKLLICGALIWTFYAAAGVFQQFLREFAKRSDNNLDEQIVKLISRSLKVFIVVVGVLLAAQNMGIQVFSVLAGLGIGGLAVALAAKDSLSNFFGSIMIMFDRPFKVGHWIVVKGQEGIVEDIGFRSTKIRTFYNSLVSIPNAEVATSPVDNLGMRRLRRVKTVIGVTYDTPPEKLETFLEAIKNVIKANPHAVSFNCHVVFNDFGPSSLNILLYFFLQVPDWATELEQRQNVLLEIVRAAKELGVEFAFPTQTVYVESFPGQNPKKQSDPLDPGRLREKAASFGPGGSAARPDGSGLYTAPFRDEGFRR
ncbi:MAG: hypothetical protein OHK005_04740 [Candidatus Methylacidiphilales bacterium]